MRRPDLPVRPPARPAPPVFPVPAAPSGVLAAVVALAAAILPAASCRTAGQPPLITVYVPDIAVSLPLPQGWTSASNEQGGFRMTTFTGPSVDVPDRDGIQVQVMAGPAPADSSLREVADRYYIGGQTVLSEESFRLGADDHADDGDPGADDDSDPEGMIWSFAFERRPQAGRLLLLRDGDRLYGVFTTGEARSVRAYGPTLDRMYSGFSLETSPYFEVYRDPVFEVEVRHPRSWTRSHVLRDSDTTLFVGFRSAPLAVEAGGATVHATLELTVEEAAPGATLESFYSEAVESLGENYRMLRHDLFADGRGIAVLYSVETQLADYLEWVIYNLVDGRTYLYRFHCRNRLYRAVEPWFAEIADRFVRSGSPPGIESSAAAPAGLFLGFFPGFSAGSLVGPLVGPHVGPTGAPRAEARRRRPGRALGDNAPRNGRLDLLGEDAASVVPGA